jgi:hypothetical protein
VSSLQVSYDCHHNLDLHLNSNVLLYGILCWEIGDGLISSCCTYYDTVLRDRRLLDFILLYLFWHCFERSEIAWSHLAVLILTLFWEIGDCLISSCCTYFDTVLRDRRLLDFILLYLFWHCFERSEIAWSHLVVLILTLFWEIRDCLILSCCTYFDTVKYILSTRHSKESQQLDLPIHITHE